MRTREEGFTLIELVSVIVIVGMLAVTMAPKFVDFNDGARASVFAQLSGSITYAADMARAQQIMEGKEANESIVFEGQTITMSSGYPTDEDIQKLMQFSEFTASNLGWFQWDKAKIFGVNCSIDYTARLSDPTTVSRFLIHIHESDC